ncbi:hypothetical protein TPHA_0F01240 [Tetrapisispora phaffii CBS 4417]|uniref:Vacuolar segregation protein 7 n=1 Tax=Tetrapisispora phaffii (strain ATCC 24235 / CBS 4417 / NBRC 1672 / NRRL Y-8282 / UCD 70-5) TaxID=1071381 RepID=G8BV27_TETPH|nr:hypothetical protein TPHA_0F01240 [Tetrapisispora phaffii CBS 4417]CCE63609.1 hypothetical protein TPHA_0F01240 [Tetrapisispora phaffii CBS 4417]
MNGDHHKFLVETEMVDTPAVNIMPTTIPAGTTAAINQDNNKPQLINSPKYESQNPIPLKMDNASSQSREIDQKQSVRNSHIKEHTYPQGTDVSDAALKSIQKQPLNDKKITNTMDNTQIEDGSSRIPSASVITNSNLDQNDLNNRVTQDMIKDSLQHMIHNEGYNNVPDHENNNFTSLSLPSKTDYTGKVPTITTPISLTSNVESTLFSGNQHNKSQKATDLRPAKIIERPSMQLLNSKRNFTRRWTTKINEKTNSEFHNACGRKIIAENNIKNNGYNNYKELKSNSINNNNNSINNNNNNNNNNSNNGNNNGNSNHNSFINNSKPNNDTINVKQLQGKNKSTDALATNIATLKNSDDNIQHSDGNDNEVLVHPTKTDFFAARLASAVGEREASDSEETFVYESAANSSRHVAAINTIESAIEGNDQQVFKNGNVQLNSNTNKTYGIAPKMSVPLLNTNKKFLNKIKNQRHTSMGAAPLGNKMSVSNVHTNVPTSNPNNMLNYANSNISPTSRTFQLVPDDLSSLRSSNSMRSTSSITQSPSHGIHMATSNGNLIHSPTHKMHVNTNGVNPQVRLRNSGMLNKNNGPSRNVSHNNQAMRQNSGYRQRAPNNSNNHENKRKLRTTASRIFDTNGAPLRKYSSIPDNVNLEDFMEEPKEIQPSTTLSNSVVRNDHFLDYHDNVQNNSHNNGFNTNFTNNTIQEEDSDINDESNNTKKSVNPQHSNSIVNTESTSENKNKQNAYHNTEDHPNMSNRNDDNMHENNTHVLEDDEDDDRSMFFYNHGGDLGTRPQISDYEDNDELIESDGADVDPRLYDTYPYYESDNRYGKRRPEHGSNYQDYSLYTGNTNRHESYSSQFANNKGFQNYNENQFVGDDDINEQTPLRNNQFYYGDESNNSPHNFVTKKSSWSKIKYCVYFSLSVVFLVTIGFILGFLLATNKELQGLNVVFIDNIISSTSILLFDLTCGAYNPGFFTINVQDADIDIFAKSIYVTENDYNFKRKNKVLETVLLGTISSLESPLEFRGEFFRRRYDVSSSSVKLLNPGKNKVASDPNGDNAINIESDVEKWKQLIKHDYELLIKGSLKYRVPFFNTERSVSIQQSIEVHPDDKDKGDDYLSLL